MRLTAGDRRRVNVQFVLPEVGTLIEGLVANGYTKQEAAKAVRWAAHTIEHGKQEQQ